MKHNNDLRTFGDRLTAAMKAKGLNQLELARRAGYSPAAISRWCHDEADPRLLALVVLCETLDVSADWLVLGRGGAKV